MKELHSRIYSIFIRKNDKFRLLFESPFGGLRANVRSTSIAYWKARGDFLYFIIVHLLLALTVETL